jgi:hypothetical protein
VFDAFASVFDPVAGAVDPFVGAVDRDFLFVPLDSFRASASTASLRVPTKPLWRAWKQHGPRYHPKGF